jgi:NAD(P)-dependent dehydrogenase (short-subunit alcohol dehydrogenase family)
VTENCNHLGLADAKVLIVGSGDLGLACAEAFVHNGARVGLIDMDAAKLERSRKRLVPADVPTRDVDASDRDACHSAISSLRRELGGLDVLVHAVGINHRLPFEQIRPEDWRPQLAANLESALWAGQGAAELMTTGGKIVYFSSVSAFLAHPHHAAYAVTKGGLTQLIRVMAVELAQARINVNGVAPGYTETELTRDYLGKPGVRAALESKVPMGRLGLSKDIVGPVLFLSSPLSNFVTGQVLLVDGGRTLD